MLKVRGAGAGQWGADNRGGGRAKWAQGEGWGLGTRGEGSGVGVSGDRRCRPGVAVGLLTNPGVRPQHLFGGEELRESKL